MIGTDHMLPPAADEVKLFFNLLNVVADAPAAAERVKQLHAAAAAAKEATTAAAVAADQLARDRAEFEEYMQSTRDKADAELKAARVAFEQESKKRNAEISRREAETTRLLLQAKADAEAAAALRADLQARLAKIREVAA